jgi:hypothetical protein
MFNPGFTVYPIKGFLNLLQLLSAPARQWAAPAWVGERLKNTWSTLASINCVWKSHDIFVDKFPGQNS